jgi:LPXTG-motif cell wall-anchored protein
MRQRLIAAVAAVAIGIVGAVALATPGNASTFTGCTGPEASVSDTQAKAVVKDINPAACLDIQFTDKCDGTTVVTMTNWAFNDNKFTVLTVELDGKEYTLKGGSSPNTETVVLGPKVEDLQAKLVFRFTTPDGELVLKKNYGDPWSWEEPKACVSPSPSASAAPSPSVTVSAPATTATTSPVGPVTSGNDLPVTGSSNTLIAVGIVLLLLVAAGAEFLRRRRNHEPVA